MYLISFGKLFRTISRIGLAWNIIMIKVKNKNKLQVFLKLCTIRDYGVHYTTDEGNLKVQCGL